jgi:hypothetical protein
MELFNVLEKNAAAAAMIFFKTYRYHAAAATIFSKTYRYRAAAAMTFSKTCRNRAAMDIFACYRLTPLAQLFPWD